jgi:hypothetical protein
MGRGGTVTRTRVHLRASVQRLAFFRFTFVTVLPPPAFWPAEEPAAARLEANLANCARRSTSARAPFKLGMMSHGLLGAGRALSGGPGGPCPQSHGRPTLT